ncbi:MAG TPA: hypothetical protein VLV86_18525 [Vicinamibacterales bacterium]|nr:hypothetical protein [Vicinamibacterales bacterium]
MRRVLPALAILVSVAATTLVAQRGGAPGGAQPQRTPQAMAPFDPTGYWVALVSDEWRYRMLTPPKGNVDYVPVTAEARNAANAWDPAKDEANGEQCRGYGAGGIMRLPIRLHITWADERTLRMDIDAGTQTRTFHFAAAGAGQAVPANTENSWQGYSVAEWQIPGGGRGAPQTPRNGQLKIVTTHLRPGYLRKNGVPYGAGSVLTEYIAHLADDDGAQYLAITSLLDDPQYLAQPWVRTSQFRKQVDAKGWNPTACSAR